MAIYYNSTTGTPGSYLAMQGDGNLVIYTPSGSPVWSTNTPTGTGNYMLQVQDPGNMVIYRDIWETGTSRAANGVTSFTAVSCSNLGPGLAMNQNMLTGSCLISNSGRFAVVMQTDGNLVIYDRSVSPLAAVWSTGTALTGMSPQVVMRTLYSYDALGNLLCVEQHGNASGTGCSAPPSSDASSPWRVRRFTYDSLSRLLTAHNPESGTITYAYDADGNLLQKTSPAPNQTGAATQTISYCYDALHRVTGKAYSAQSCPLTSPVVTYSYDSGTFAIGKLTSLTDQAGSASYTYDNLGRMISETRVIAGVSKSMSYDYNLDGSIKTIHYPSGAAVTYAPDFAGRLLSAVDIPNNINYITGAQYQADGQLTGFISGNAAAFAGITNTFSFNKRLQPINMSASAPSQTVFSIGYDFHVGNGVTGADNGNVWGITNYKDNSRNQSFTYDSLNRLTSAQNAGTNCAATLLNGKTEYWGNSYTYDAWGNLTNKTVTKCGAENLSAPSLPNNQLSGYGYDAAGNMTSDPTDGLTLTYDQENRIQGAGGYSYTYDADGNRVKKSNGSTGTIYWYMAPGIVAESDLAGTLKSEYVFFDGERVARRDLPAGTVAYYFSDHLKTASVITDSLGNIKSESDYYPWGGELQFVNNDSNHYKFTGKERDETGLDYFGARYYSNGLARFITPDWAAKATAVPYAEFADPQSLNLYTYVRNVPTSRVDVDGHCWPIAQCAHIVMDKVNQVQASLQNKAEGVGPTVAAVTTFTTGVTRDVINGVAGLGTVGEASGAAWNGTATDRIIAGLEDGGKVGGLILLTAPMPKVIGNAQAGAIGEARYAADLQENGGEVLGRQIGVRTSDGSGPISDFYTRQPNGTNAFVEVKTGNGELSNAQQNGYPLIQSEGGRVMPSGGRAAQAGLSPGPIGPTQVITVRYPRAQVFGPPKPLPVPETNH
jgi:RHS repeat-associated protein